MSLLLSQLGGGGGTAWTLNLSDTVTLSDALAKGISISKSDTVTLSEAISKGIGLIKSDTVTLSEEIAKAFGKFNSDTVTLSENIIKSFGVNLSDSVTLNDSVSGGTGGGGTPQPVLAYRWYWVKIYIQKLEGRNVYRIKIFD